jgi:hypothetical protein
MAKQIEIFGPDDPVVKDILDYCKRYHPKTLIKYSQLEESLEKNGTLGRKSQ